MSDAALVLVVNAVLGAVGFFWFRVSNAVGALKRLLLPDIPSKSDVDRIFSSTKAKWNQRVSAAEYLIGWSIRIQPRAEGDSVQAFDRKTGRGVSLLASYPRNDGPPESLRLDRYFPAGQLLLDESFRNRIESLARSGLGTSYGVTVRLARTPDGKFDVVSLLITPQVHLSEQERRPSAALETGKE